MKTIIILLCIAVIATTLIIWKQQETIKDLKKVIEQFINEIANAYESISELRKEINSTFKNNENKK